MRKRFRFRFPFFLLQASNRDWYNVLLTFMSLDVVQ